MTWLPPRSRDATEASRRDCRPPENYCTPQSASRPNMADRTQRPGVSSARHLVAQDKLDGALAIETRELLRMPTPCVLPCPARSLGARTQLVWFCQYSVNRCRGV